MAMLKNSTKCCLVCKLARGNLLTDHMFISILGLGLRDTTPLFLRVLHFPPSPSLLTCCHWWQWCAAKMWLQSCLATEPTGVSTLSRGRLPEGAGIAGGGMRKRLVAPVFPSKLSHVIKYHGGADRPRSVFLSESSHVSKYGTRGGWKVLQVSAVTITWSVTAAAAQQVLLWQNYPTLNCTTGLYVIKSIQSLYCQRIITSFVLLIK